MAYVLQVNQENDQFQQLISAISSSGGSGGAGPWVVGATNVTSYSLQNIPADEYLVIQKVKLPNNTYASTVFTFPKSSILTTGTLIDGYYYNSNYYGSFGIKLTSTEISNDASWIRMYYGGTVITNATFDVYYRSNQGTTPTPTPTSFDYIIDGVSGVGCTVLDGGYYKLGNMVFVQFRVQTTTAGQFEIHGIPKSRFTLPLSTFNGSQGANVTTYSYVTNGGLIRTIGNNYQSGDVVVISGCYLEGGE